MIADRMVEAGILQPSGLANEIRRELDSVREALLAGLAEATASDRPAPAARAA